MIQNIRDVDKCSGSLVLDTILDCIDFSGSHAGKLVRVRTYPIG